MSFLRMHPRKETGFGLIELMVAMVLGLLVLGAAFAIFQSNQRTFGANEGLNRAQENARVAYEMISRDIRSAGGSACSNEAQVPGSDSYSQAFRAPLSGSNSEFTAVSADDVSYRVKDADPNSVTLVESAPTATDIFKAKDVVMVCNGAMTGFAKVASVSGQTITFDAPLAFDPDDTEGAAAASVSIALFRDSRWHVAANGRASGTSLYVSRFGASPGDEVAEGVSTLALSYHQTGASSYGTGLSDYSRVNAVRLGMTMKAPVTVKSSEVPDFVTRQASTTVNIRSRP